MELSLFNYSLVKFVPDRVRDESLNLGVIVLSAENGEASSAFLSKFKSRLKVFDPWVDSAVIERLLETLKERIGTYQIGILSSDSPIRSTVDVQFLRDTMKNQLQVTELKPYRALSLERATSELYSELVSPHNKPPNPQKGMSLPKLRRLIREAIRSWGGDWYKIKEDGLRQSGQTRHFADFWLDAGRPLAAFIAIPDDPGERDVAWMRRDSVPTIASEFSRLDPQFKTVVVFPPNGTHPSTEFVSETLVLLGGIDGVIVTHANDLAQERDIIAPQFV